MATSVQNNSRVVVLFRPDTCKFYHIIRIYVLQYDMNTLQGPR